jgi:hypothetical protein
VLPGTAIAKLCTFTFIIAKTSADDAGTLPAKQQPHPFLTEAG